MFASEFENREFEFIEYMFNVMINEGLDYHESWKAIQHKFNSLNRYSNLWIFLKKYEI